MKSDACVLVVQSNDSPSFDNKSPHKAMDTIDGSLCHLPAHYLPDCMLSESIIITLSGSFILCPVWIRRYTIAQQPCKNTATNILNSGSVHLAIAHKGTQLTQDWFPGAQWKSPYLGRLLWGVAAWSVVKDGEERSVNNGFFPKHYNFPRLGCLGHSHLFQTWENTQQTLKLPHL